MRYRSVPCSPEQLVPTRWIVGGYPSRQTVAQHLAGLIARHGIPTARECRRQMIWVGIYPTRSMKRTGGQSAFNAVD